MRASRQPSVLFRVVALFIALTHLTAPVMATCGGGGGGGAGGMSGASMPDSRPQVYNVPWKLLKAGETAPTDGLVVYWFPASSAEVGVSDLRTSRDLALWSAEGVTPIAADTTMTVAQQFKIVPKVSVVVVTDGTGKEIGRLEGQKGGPVKTKDVEKVVRAELKARESAVAKTMSEAKAKAKAGDKPAAIELYQSVWGQRVLFPKKAKDAAKELKKLGVTVASDDTINRLQELEAIHDGPVALEVVATMDRGLQAEEAGDYELAKGLYLKARALDPADPAPARYLGELYRHHTGEWDKARVVFEQMLTERIDPLSEAVAYHGLGKMTIHEGSFVKGLRLMERSLDAFPLALTYRNIAVFWNSECDPVKAARYAELALALEPTDPYNRVFAAVFMAANGKKDEALKIAQENDGLMAASYNLAGIYAQTGDKEKALAYLKRHFYTYERYHEVRAKEMMEARVDAVFDTIRADVAFVKLTEFADGRLPIPDFPRQPMTFPKGTN